MCRQKLIEKKRKTPFGMEISDAKRLTMDGRPSRMTLICLPNHCIAMRHLFCAAFVLVSVVGSLTLTGCDEKERKNVAILLGAIKSGIDQSFSQRDVPWHKKYGLEAEFFFNNPKVIALCKAIEAKDLKEIDRLIADGADVNAKGKGNWTPLLWAYPTNLEIFTKILIAGADPNVQLTGDFEHSYELYFMFIGNRGCYIREGSSVMEMAALGLELGYFEAVMKHGGDPNLVSKTGNGDTPLHSIATWWSSTGHINRIAHAKLLLDAGANINTVSRDGTPVIVAVKNNQFDLALFLLEAGADWKIEPKFDPNFFPGTLVRNVFQYENISFRDDKLKESYNMLVSLLKEKGADFDQEREKDEQDRQRFFEIFGRYPNY